MPLPCLVSIFAFTFGFVQAYEPSNSGKLAQRDDNPGYSKVRHIVGLWMYKVVS